MFDILAELLSVLLGIFSRVVAFGLFNRFAQTNEIKVMFVNNSDFKNIFLVTNHRRQKNTSKSQVNNQTTNIKIK